MNWLMKRALVCAAVALFVFSGCKATMAQQTSPYGGMPIATDAVPTQPGSAATGPSGSSSTQLLSSSAPMLKSQVRRQPPAAAPAPLDLGMGSQQAPFAVTPDTPAASNDQNFYSGNPPVQDLSSLLAGRFNDTKYKWYGFVRVDGIFDFRPMGTTDAFVTSAIPVPQGSGQNYALTPRYTRFGFDTETPLKFNDWTLKTRIEMDFFNGFSSGAFGSFPLRLRFAWADFGPFLIGQAASLFMDYDVFPNVLDYEGPPGMVLMRQPIVALRVPLGERFKVSVGIEQPYSDIQWFDGANWIKNPGNGIITTPGVARNIQDVPDLTWNIRYVGTYGHVQLAGIARKLTYQGANGDQVSDVGYGGNVTASLHPWALLSGTPTSGDCSTPLSRSRILGQFAAGNGINRYIQDVNGLGLDATFDPANGFRLIPSYGWFAAYEQWWGEKWASVFSFSMDDSDLTGTLPATTYKSAQYISGNLIWLPLPRMGVGVEYLYGYRKNHDGTIGDNHRIQAAFQYKF
jgi:hypothetical protein